MIEIALPVIGTVAAWRSEARRLAGEGVPAEAVIWRVGTCQADLFAGRSQAQATTRAPVQIHLSKDALGTIETALCHSDPERFARAYALVLRMSGGRVKWGDRSDPMMLTILAQAKAVSRDIHKMHAFVRFREVDAVSERRAFAAWFEPEHPIVEAASSFFAKRFGDMDWVIATPVVTARFRSGQLDFVMTKAGAHSPEDATEELWRTYYAAIFNPARLMVRAMQSEMPKKYWKNLPEARLIPELIRTAPERAASMQAALPSDPPQRLQSVARDMVERSKPLVGCEGHNGLERLRAAAADCRRCPLHKSATQTVFGVGPKDAALMIVGEQPGDLEDLAGQPFVGPAGHVLDQVSMEVGLDVQKTYITNAVKHFKFKAQGRKRLHQRPTIDEIDACRGWLWQEIHSVKPRLILAMGATAAEALTGTGTNIRQRVGRVEPGPNGIPVLITFHPSFILRLQETAPKEAARLQLRQDLAMAAQINAGGELSHLPTD